MQFDPDRDDLTLHLYAGDGAEATRLQLLEGTAIAFDPGGDGGGRAEVTGDAGRRYRLSLPFGADVPLRTVSGDARIEGGEATWVGPAVIDIGRQR